MAARANGMLRSVFGDFGLPGGVGGAVGAVGMHARNFWRREKPRIIWPI